MTDANQVRINELARELEVKAKAIIDLLPGYGVTEKKTHSSSIPADVAEKVRKKIQGAAEAEAQEEAAAKAEKEAKDAAAKAARMRPVAPTAAPPVSVAPAAVKPSAPAVPAVPVAKPIAPDTPSAAAPVALKAPASVPVVAPPPAKPAAPAPTTAPAARDGHSRLDRAAPDLRVDHNPGLLSSVAARCRQALVRAPARPGVQECCRPFQRKCRRRRSRVSRFTPASRPSASVPLLISASKRVNANCTRPGSVRARAAARLSRLSRRPSRVRRAR